MICHPERLRARCSDWRQSRYDGWHRFPPAQCSQQAMGVHDQCAPLSLSSIGTGVGAGCAGGASSVKSMAACGVSGTGLSDPSGPMRRDCTATATSSSLSSKTARLCKKQHSLSRLGGRKKETQEELQSSRLHCGALRAEAVLAHLRGMRLPVRDLVSSWSEAALADDRRRGTLLGVRLRGGIRGCEAVLARAVRRPVGILVPYRLLCCLLCWALG